MEVGSVEEECALLACGVAFTNKTEKRAQICKRLTHDHFLLCVYRHQKLRL